MYIKYDNEGNILSMSGEELTGENTELITTEMVDAPFERRDEVYYDIENKMIKHRS